MVIGGGTAVLVAAHVAALAAKVALIERYRRDNDGLNVGCAPSKAIIHTSHLYAETRTAEHYGVQIPADIRDASEESVAVVKRTRSNHRKRCRSEAAHG
ncbi:MAG: hypothetical protein COW59_07750 [Lysobacterales bacterium CG17_big_fil_post_rev_8_21_14_2_50_64_11]|nr:MAG: hypothetical protein COW59_07750 [Xanthomonadales bacterium CG17_big_fil_post_rev_8_21_14_2_50_64_11]PIX60031.1 MAG: hypothetical protein COZ47_09385 [Xanthomonadales bacterium CG_4_10_14_3_um_filter_64_11]